MRIAYFGSSRFSCIVLEALRRSAHEIVAVVTQPDQPAGRRLELMPTELCCQADIAGLPVLKPAQLRGNAAFRKELSGLRPEALMVASYGQIIPPKVLGLTPWPLNVHPSLLPRLRGASPVRSALLQGCSESGCSIMRMTERMDDGDILLQEHMAIPPAANYFELEQLLAQLGGRLAVAALDTVAAGTARLVPQDHVLATYSRIVRREDTYIDWMRPACELDCFIRAWDPDLGAVTALPDGRRLKIWRAGVATPPGGVASAPAAVIAISKTHIWVQTGEGALRIDEVQAENKPRISAASFLAGSRLAVGDILRIPA